MRIAKFCQIKSKNAVRKIKRSREKMYFITFFLMGAILPMSHNYYKEFKAREKTRRDIASVAPSDGQAISVSVRDIEKRNIEKIFSSFTNLKPSKEINLVPEAKVHVKKILVKSGEKVKKGQILVLLDSEALRLKKELSAIELNLKKSEYKLATALAEKDYVSKNELNQKKLDYKSDEIKRKIEELEGGAEKLVAPFDGVVADIKMKEGDFVEDNTKYSIKVIDNQKFKVDLYVPHSVAMKLKKGNEAYFVAENNEKMVAQITNIAPTIDPQTGTVYIEVEGENKDLKWVSGIFVKTELTLEKKENVFAIKNQSILYDKEKPYAYRVVASNNSNIAQKVYLELGVTDGDFIEVKEGINELDQMVVEGQSELKDQTRVEIFSYQNK